MCELSGLSSSILPIQYLKIKKLAVSYQGKPIFVMYPANPILKYLPQNMG